MMYSSGTTGLPKGVMITHYNMTSNILQNIDFIGEDTKTRSLCVLPLFHATGMLYEMLLHLVKGYTVYTLPSFDPQTFLSACQMYQVTCINMGISSTSGGVVDSPLGSRGFDLTLACWVESLLAVPPMILFLLHHPLVPNYDISSLQNVAVGAAPIDKNVLTEFTKKFPKILIQQGYGMTESLVTHSQADGAANHKYGSAGRVLSNTEWKVQCLETGKTLPAYHKGELYTRGPQIMKGYHNNEEETKKCLSEDGWLRSGDLGYYDEDFNIFIVDRLKELIKCKGFQVAPAELEDLLHGHEDITDSCVIGVPDEKYGEVPYAFVVKKIGSDLTEEDVHKFVNENVSDYKTLRGGVKFVDVLPRSPAGKLLRRVLKEEYASK
ncbi:uncharacterized protein LOC130642241 [Hydractinia symbiolongicarpus]|uniref:uncharacterized protein LOC130642241 n=1 Tax=Hydractinia symbiolongicarpus TaxID=13093 RepID=UPI002549ED30|nr:uncharacterized protein LOC130642241 [Hydractinia symbiolongicarpus]